MKMLHSLFVFKVVVFSILLLFYSTQSVEVDGGPNWRKEYILITGGAGSLGSFLAHHLSRTKYHVVLYDLHSPSNVPTIAVSGQIQRQRELLHGHSNHRDGHGRSKSLLDPSQHIVSYTGDVRDLRRLSSLILKINKSGHLSGIIHLAGISRPKWCDSNIPDCLSVNAAGTESLLNAIKEASMHSGLDPTENSTDSHPNKVKPWFILSSSASVYGAPPSNSKESPVHLLSESDQLKPSSLYGQSKLQAEETLRNFPGIDSILSAVFILRLGSVYGGLHDHSDRLIPNLVTSMFSRQLFPLITNSMTGSSRTLDYLFIDDLWSTFSLITSMSPTSLNAAKAKFSDKKSATSSSVMTFNVGSSWRYSVPKVMAVTANVLNMSLPSVVVVDDDSNIASEAISISRLRELFKIIYGEGTSQATYSPVPLAQGLKSYLSRLLSRDAAHLRNRYQRECESEKKHQIAQLSGCSVVLQDSAHRHMTFFISGEGDNMRFSGEQADQILQQGTVKQWWLQKLPSQSTAPPPASKAQPSASITLQAAADSWADKAPPFLLSWLKDSIYQSDDFAISEYKAFHPHYPVPWEIGVPTWRMSFEKSRFARVLFVKSTLSEVLVIDVAAKFVGQLEYDGAVSTRYSGEAASARSVDFNFAVGAMSCSHGAKLPFLSRNPKIYQMRGFRSSEEEAAGLIHKEYCLECNRLRAAAERNAADLVRLQRLTFINKSSDEVFDPNATSVLYPKLQAATEPLVVADLVRLGGATRFSDLSLDALAERAFKQPVCDYDCALHRVCLHLPNNLCKCVMPQICLKKTSFAFEAFAGLNVTTFPLPTFYAHSNDSSDSSSSSSSSSGLRLSERLALMPLSLSLTTLGAYIHRSGAAAALKVHAPATLKHKPTPLELCFFNCHLADSFTFVLGKVVSVPVEDADFIFYNSADENSALTQDSLRQAIGGGSDPSAALTKAKASAKVVTFKAHDMGACNFEHSEYRFDNYRGSDPKAMLRQAIVMAPMGGFNLNCYSPDKDIAAAPVSTKTHLLRRDYLDVNKVLVSSQRRYLVAFAGSVWGTGMFQRVRVMKATLYPHTLNDTVLQKPTAEGTKRYGGDGDNNYMYTLGNSKFCVMARGITGWSFRLCDAIYAGCIPVFNVDMLHNFYHEVIDYTKFALFLEEREVEGMERLLTSLSPQVVDQMQMRLLKVRSAFLYDYGNLAVNWSMRDDAFVFNWMALALKSKTLIF